MTTNKTIDEQGKHFYIGKDTEPSYCGKTPSMDFDETIIDDSYYCSECLRLFEKSAIGAMSEEIAKMSEVIKPQANKTIDEILRWYGEAVDSQGYEVPELDEATKAITQAMLEALPEKVEWDMSLDLTGGEVDQYNKAIDQMESAIKKMGGDKNDLQK